MMTVREIAKRLLISPACVYAILEKGELACYRIGVGRGAIRVTEEQLAAYLEKRQQGRTTVKPSAPVKLKHLS